MSNETGIHWIPLTQEHLDNGTQEQENCPIALAIGDYIRVNQLEMPQPFVESANLHFDSLYHPEVNISPRLRDFINEFDHSDGCHPHCDHGTDNIRPYVLVLDLSADDLGTLEEEQNDEHSLTFHKAPCTLEHQKGTYRPHSPADHPLAQAVSDFLSQNRFPIHHAEYSDELEAVIVYNNRKSRTEYSLDSNLREWEHEWRNGDVAFPFTLGIFREEHNEKLIILP